VLLFACSEGPPVVLDLTISTVDTLVAAETEFFERPTEIVLGPGGQLFVTDVSASTILVLDTTGQRIREIGRTGSGPEEFRGPRSVTPIRDTLFVVDGGNGRLQRVTADGIFAEPSSLPPAALRGAVSISSAGDMLVSRNGRDSTIAVLVDRSGTIVRRLGEPPAVLPAQFDFVEVKREIRAGRIPAMLRAITLPVLAADRSAWLVLVGEGEVRRYASDGALVWTASLKGPEIDSIRNHFFELNRADDSPNQFVTLNYVAAARPSRYGLWLLLRMPEDEGAVFVVLNSQGEIAAWVRVPTAIGIRSFTLDDTNRTLYMLDYYAGTVLRWRLPESLSPQS
jgi:DNA-binding beta-propeller fold protein YncE